MTGYTVHTGSTEKFSQGWDQIFGQKQAAKKPARKKAATAAGTKKKPSAKKNLRKKR